MEAAGAAPHLSSIPYAERKALFIADESNYNATNKHCVIQLAKFRKQLPNDAIITEYLSKVRNQTDFVDFILCILVRLLYFDYEGNPTAQAIIDLIVKDLHKFPFWPISSNEKCNHTFGFWSENHAFLFLSSAHLFQQKYGGGKLDPDYGGSQTRETYLLRSCLIAHRHAAFNGVYEVLSHVYLPYTLPALINLIDFSNDAEIKFYATELVNCILNQLALVTSDKGVSSLSASARTFDRCRTRTWGHNLNQLMLMITGISIDKFAPNAITGFFLTSDFVPNEESLRTTILEESYFPKLPMNHSVSETENIYSSLAENDKIPFLWFVSFLIFVIVTYRNCRSAGLVTHPEFIERTKRFQNIHGLVHHPHLKPLSFLPSSISHLFMDSFSHFSRGQNYTGINLSVYKAHGGLVLSSFDAYNVGLCGYQQLPWMLNADGVGIWSQSGSATKLGYFQVTNLYSPHVTQNRRLLVAVYSV
jgi:hypothetical protein